MTLGTLYAFRARDLTIRHGTSMVGGAGALVAACLLAPGDAMRVYLALYLLVLGLPLGAMLLLLTHEITGGRWGLAARRGLLTLTALLPLPVLLFIPIAIMLSRLYPWAGPDAESLEFQRHWLQPGFFLARAAVCFIVWLGIAGIRLSASPDADRGGPLAPVALILLVVTGSFAVMDWGMSVEPEWRSTSYGAIQLAFFLTSAMAAVLVLLPSETAEEFGSRTVSDLGKLLLVGIAGSAYMAFMQFLILWAGNEPDRVEWYVKRSTDGWGMVLVAAVVAGLVVPFFALIASRVRHDRARLRIVAALVLCALTLRALWLIVPAGGTSALPLALVAAGFLALVWGCLGSLWRLRHG
jgi:hypothetical protein